VCIKEELLCYKSFDLCCLALILIFKTPMSEILLESEQFSCLVD